MLTGQPRFWRSGNPGLDSCVAQAYSSHRRHGLPFCNSRSKISNILLMFLGYFPAERDSLEQISARMATRKANTAAKAEGKQKLLKPNSAITKKKADPKVTKQPAKAARKAPVKPAAAKVRSTEWGAERPGC